MKNTVNLSEFLSGQDLVWNRMPCVWYEAPFVANGFFGCTAYFTDDKSLILALGHTCVYDNREVEFFGDDTLIKTPRLPVGKIAVSFAGKVTGTKMRLDIYNAVVNGEIFTEKGSVSFSLKSLNGIDCIAFDYEESGNEKIAFEYVEPNGTSPRVNTLRQTGENAFEDYKKPHEMRCTYKEHGATYVQPYFNGGGFAVCTFGKDGAFLVSLGYDDCSDETAERKCEDIIETVLSDKTDIELRHREWWNSFYKKSFVSWNDGMYENFYYIQLYKLACSSRENGRPFDTCGPWLTDDTRWPGAWWNLNVELTVSPLYTSNHIDIAKCVSNAISSGFETLINNVPEKYRKDCAAIGRNTGPSLFAPVAEPGNMDNPNWTREAGNLIWTLFYCYTEYKYTGNKELIEKTVFPLLKRSVQYYLYFLYKGDDGKLHIPSTISPEYNKADSDDVNYDISLLKWALLKLIELNDEFGFNDEKYGEWKTTLENLTDYPQRENEGLMIAAQTPYAESHRHYSHILAFYPLHVLDRDNTADRKLVETTINFWQSKPEALLGYSQTGAASMRAMLRDGNAALRHLDNLMNGFVQANTMYHEGGNPVLETPPSAATAILEMFVQSHDGYIEFFPAVPDKWNNICFDRLLCQGGFEVSAELENGRLKWLSVCSLRGTKCRIKADFGDSEPLCDKAFTKTGKLFEVELKKGESVTFGDVENAVVHAVPEDRKNTFGLN